MKILKMSLALILKYYNEKTNDNINFNYYF